MIGQSRQITPQEVTSILSHSKPKRIVGKPSGSEVIYEAQLPESTEDKISLLIVKTAIFSRTTPNGKKLEINGYYLGAGLCRGVADTANVKGCEAYFKEKVNKSSEEDGGEWSLLSKDVKVASVLYGNLDDDGYIDVLIQLSNGAGILLSGQAPPNS